MSTYLQIVVLSQQNINIAVHVRVQVRLDFRVLVDVCSVA